MSSLLIRKLFRVLQQEIDSTFTFWFLLFANSLGWSWIANQHLRPMLLRIYGFKVGRKASVCPGLRIYSRLDDVRIGEQSFINQNCFIDAAAPVRIGRFCQVGFNVMFATSGHTLKSDFQGLRPRDAKPITIEDHVWIGAGAVILQGVTVGKGSVVAAGAVVSKDVPPNVVVGGIPAKILRELSDTEDLISEDSDDMRSHFIPPSGLHTPQPQQSPIPYQEVLAS
jgi:maltose O-acetyltransferase